LVLTVLILFRSSYHSAIEFDCRPGLKFLVQKVAQLSKAANLYKQAGAAWNLIALTLFDLCLVQIRTRKDVNSDLIKSCLEKQQRNRNTTFAAVQDGGVCREKDGEISEQVSSLQCAGDGVGFMCRL
jgi:hypothetical protein